METAPRDGGAVAQRVYALVLLLIRIYQNAVGSVKHYPPPRRSYRRAALLEPSQEQEDDHKKQDQFHGTPPQEVGTLDHRALDMTARKVERARKMDDRRDVLQRMSGSKFSRRSACITST